MFLLMETREIACISANLYSPRALSVIRSGREDHCQSLRALSGMDDNAADISGTRGTSHQKAVWSQSEVRVIVGIVDIGDDLLRIKQNDEIVRQQCDRVHLQFIV